MKVAAINACGTSAYKTLSIGSCASPVAMNSTTERPINNSFSDIYPNPVHNEFIIEITNDAERDIIIEVYDILGNKLIQQPHDVTSGQSLIKTNIEDYNSGIYFVRLVDKDNNVLYTQRVVKE